MSGIADGYQAYMNSLIQKNGTPGFGGLAASGINNIGQYPVTPGIAYKEGAMVDFYGKPAIVDFYGRPMNSAPAQGFAYGAGHIPQSKTFIDGSGRIVDQSGRPLNQFANYDYYGSLDPFNFRDTQYSVHPREVEKIDRMVARVLRAEPVAQKLFRTIFTGKGKRVYKHHLNVDPMDPILGDDFNAFEPAHEEFKEFEEKMTAVWKDYSLGMVTMDASRFGGYLESNILERTIMEFTAMVRDFRERIYWRGRDIRTNNRNNQAAPAGYTGIANSTKLLTVPVTATTIAADLTTAGDFAKAIVQLAAPLIQAYYPTPFAVATTPGVILQGIKNRNAFSDKTDLKNVNELGKEQFGIDIVDTIVHTPHLLKVAETNNNAIIMVIARKDQAGLANVVLPESYPAWHRPLNLGTQIGMAGKIGWMGGGFIKRQDSAVISDALTLDVY